MNMDIETRAMQAYGITPLPKEPVVAMAYVPYQDDFKLYSAQQGVVTGTMFPVLDKPFLGGKKDD